MGDFARARALCERERQPGGEVQLGEFLGSIALGFAELGSGRYAAALRAFEEVTGPPQKDRLALMDWILHMPVRLGLGQYWLARRQFGRAREQMQELCRLAATPGERTYLALGHQASPRRRSPQRDCRPPSARCPRRSTRSTDTRRRWRSGESARRPPVPSWRVAAGRRRTPTGARSAAVLDRLATSLKDDADLHRSFLAQTVVRTVRRKAGVHRTDAVQ